MKLSKGWLVNLIFVKDFISLAYQTRNNDKIFSDKNKFLSTVFMAISPVPRILSGI